MNYDPLKDGISSVELIDNMGTDLTVVNAARVSMAKQSEFDFGCSECGKTDCGSECPGWYGDMILKESDTKLINYLAKHKHWTPFSHPQVQLRIKMPIFIARQWFKHMIGFTRNEVSRRYVSGDPEMYMPKEWRLKAANVKQGSSEQLFCGTPYILSYNETGQATRGSTGGFTANSTVLLAVRMYNSMIEQGICPEQARMVLPQSMYTEFVETGSLAAYARLASLRLDPHAQKEVRQYAEAIDALMEQLYPISWKALKGNA